MPDPDVDVEMPIEDAAEREQVVGTPESQSGPPQWPIEANEADVAEQSVVVEGEDDYR